MLETIIIADDFYADPMEVRAFALAQSFTVKGNYPGMRTASFLSFPVLSAIQQLVKIPITWWPTDNYNGAFQVSLSSDRTWVHADHTTCWSGVLYLTPDAPVSGGTAFFKHKATGLDWYPQDEETRKTCDRDGSSAEQWLRTDQVANRFNRLVLFRGGRFHCSQGHFGQSKEDGRLFQTFFFNTLH
ncbi:DUF6445 family protein [Roseateles terrae]|uniref:Uncharacterized protein n=1 Tax=Roseateles terrae TaxID=431060 RepID=A0ABR6GLG6_9BURK|nr:DUF6445 family protein [Roseateles terrae]MBB3192907.1 hypothetical protein [Roseateles terrae]OWQ89836.1 hypothetical protein CDN98_04860 [Roseateles terrae]